MAAAAAAAVTTYAPPAPMEEDDEKVKKRTRDLLASFYTNTNANATPSSSSMDAAASINSSSFDPHSYMSLLVERSNLEELLQKHVQMAAEIKNLDTDLQMLVYENYNKFISATDTIKRMKSNILGMETNMEHLLAKITSVQSKSDTVNTCLFQKRDHIEKLHRSRNLLRKVQFIYDLPTRLNKCIKAEAYSDAVRFFTGAKPIFQAYGDSSFQECMRASEEAIDIVIENLKAKLYSDSEPIEARAEAVVLLKQLNFPVDNLKSNLLEKLEDCLLKLEDDSKDASVGNIAKTFRAYLIIFPDSERRLIQLAQTLFSRRYDTVREQLKKRVPSVDLLGMLGSIWEDVTSVDQVLPEAALPALSLEAARNIIKHHISVAFFHLLREISDALIGSFEKSNEGTGELVLHNALEKSKKTVIQGSMDLLLEFQEFYNEKLELLPKLRDLITDWVQEGFQEFFQNLHAHFLALSGQKESSIIQMTSARDKLPTGLVLVLSQLSLYIEQSVIPKITEGIAGSFSGVGVRAYEYGPAFVPGEICRLFRSHAQIFLHLYINRKTRKISVLLKKRFATPIWIKHKEPREVHMFVELLLSEVEGAGMEVKQMLPGGTNKRHRNSDSGSTTSSSWSNPLPNPTSRPNPNRTKSQFLESHLAKLFEQKLDIFTKVEYTQESVISTVVKLVLKSLQELVRLQTFNRTGFQQIQLDMEFLKAPLKNLVEDDQAVIDFLLKEVNNAAHERCLDPIPLEAPILDKLITAKLAKNKDPSSL